jgi:AmmeMemoRadiSam system protein A
MDNQQPLDRSAKAAVYSPEDRELLLSLARRGLAERVAGRVFEPGPEAVPAPLREERACFVTLFARDALRGCIGQVKPQMPLFRAVVTNACSAGFHDSRFECVTRDEVPLLRIEISVLSTPSRIDGGPDEVLSRLRPQIDGVLIEHHATMATFLPQVWKHTSDKVQFLHRLCQKAGWDNEAWKDPNAKLYTYEVESFES